MTGGKRFVIYGLTRLTVRVAGLLRARDADVAVVAREADREVKVLLDPGIDVRVEDDVDAGLRAAAAGDAACILALADDDLQNLDVAVGAAAIAPDVPVVLRAFHPALVDQLDPSLNVRRAYSVSGLAAPAFVAAAFADEVVEVLRLADQEIPILRFAVLAGSKTAGATAGGLKARSGCAVVAHAPAAGRWRPAGPEEVLEPGEEVLVGGPLLQVLRLALENSPLLQHGRGDRWRVRTTKVRASAAGAQAAPPARRRRHSAVFSARGTFLPASALGLTLLLVASVLVFAVALGLAPVDALYFAITTALGNSTLDDSHAWLKVFGVVSMVAGGALLGVLFSYLAALATAQRLEQRMGRRADRLRGHAVVVGLGTVGYRVERLLFELGIPTAVIDRSADARFTEAVGDRTPVLAGDVRLPENLERTGVARAAFLFACTDDDLANVQACIQARRFNPGIRTVARIFDENLAERFRGALGIDEAISTTRVAASAFVGAATEAWAPRPIDVDGVPYLALRYVVDATVPSERIDGWRSAGIRILAFRRADRIVRPASELTGGLEPGDAAIVVGPEDVMRDRVLPGLS